MSADERLYFAYGSNLYPARMRARVPSARVVATGRVPGFRLAFRKCGRDGSAKCDLEPAPEATVWGALYRFDAAEQQALDAAEGPGYYIDAVTVTTAAGFVEAFTYRARRDWIDATAIPYDWYRDLVLAGARTHEFPDMYVAAIADFDTVPDPDPDRAAANRPR